MSVDIKEYLKLVINQPDNDKSDNRVIDNTEEKETISKASIQQFLTAKSIYDLQNIINPSTRYKKNYLILDSRYRIPSSSTTLFRWRYAETANNQLGVVNSIDTIKNIVSMKLMQASFGYLFDQLDSYNNNRISILVNELLSQSFISDADTNYHWILRRVFNVDTSSYNRDKTQILQTENFNDGIYNFVKPVTKLDTLSISFADPVNQLSLWPDYIKIKFNWSAPTNATLNYIYNDPPVVSMYAYNQSMVFISNFTTATPYNTNDQQLISFINSPFGLQIEAISGNAFVVNIPASILALPVNPIADLELEAYFALSRFILPIEFTYIT